MRENIDETRKVKNILRVLKNLPDNSAVSNGDRTEHVLCIIAFQHDGLNLHRGEFEY